MCTRANLKAVCLIPIFSTLMLSNALAQQTSRGVADSASASVTLEPGPYYALVIGNNNYLHLNKLQTAVSDAQEMARVLHDTYGFTTRLLYNATRDDILTALVDYRRTLPPNSNLLIYYAGHGFDDRDAGEAYWLPIDAQKDNNENWISADDITRDVRTIASQHVLIISDSCYSGVLSRDADAAINPRERGVFLAKMWSSKSRTLMASGGDEPVADGGGGGHSVFANAVLQSLAQMAETEFTAGTLFQHVQPMVAGRSEQLPQYNLIRNSGHSFGDFVFSRGGKPFAASAVKIETSGDDIPEDADLTTAADKAPLRNSISNEQAIQKVLDSYQQAYNFRDSSILWKIWPNAPTKTRQDIEKSFRSASSINMTLRGMGSPEIGPDGQTATVRGQCEERFVPKNGSAQPSHIDEIVFTLQRADGTWLITTIK